MAFGNPVWIFLLLVCFLDPSWSFSIRRRSLDAYRDQNPYDLTSALKVLDRERRRLDTNGYGEMEWNDDNNDILPDGNDLGTFGPYGQRYQTYPYLEDYPEQQIYVPDKTFRNYHAQKTVPSVSELEKIFGEQDTSEISENDGVPANDQEIQMPQSEAEDHSNKGTAITGGSVDVKRASNNILQGLSEDQMKTLLNEVDRMQKENIQVPELQQTSEPDETSQAVPVSKEELEEVFESEDGNEDGDKGGEEVNIETGEQPISVEIASEAEEVPSMPVEPLSDTERYWLLKSYLYDGTPKRVVKRNNRVELSLPSDAARLSEEVSRLRSEVARLKLVHAVEDKENDILADALKGATMAQLQRQGSNVYVSEEFKDIEDAIKIEELLQMVKTEDDDDEEVKEMVEQMLLQSRQEDEEEGVEGGVGKRGSNIVDTDSLDDDEDENNFDEGEMGIWYDSPVTEGVSDGAYLQDNEEDEDEGDEDDDSDESIENIILHMTPEERRQLAVEVETALLKEETGMCPAVDRLSTDCKFADDLGLPLDADARSLCNRHEMCYKCGATLGMSEAQCNAGYRGDAYEVCEDEQCQGDAEAFLALMTQVHRYFPFDRVTCKPLCIRDFIYGVN